MAPHAQEALPSVAPVSKMASAPAHVEAITDTSGAVMPDPVMQVNPTRPRFRPHDVLPHRQSSKALMSKNIAPFSSATMFKSDSAIAKPKATRSFCQSHLSLEAKARKASSLKGAIKLLQTETISLCGGLPSSEYFPFEEFAYQVPTSPDFLPDSLKTLKSGKYDVREGQSELDLSIILNYGQSMGPPQLMRYLTEHTEIVHAPPYSDWEICLTQGSTSALDIALRCFCARGEALLTEEYSFSSAIETALPMGLMPVGIKMDGKGLCDRDLEYVLGNWESGDCVGETRYGGVPRPKVLYTVPTGQNPTGATQDEERRRKILAICEKYDVFIIEDEPYYFLQMEKYVPKASKNGHENGEANGNGHAPNGTSTHQDLSVFLDSLVPSYLALSKTGNVLRMDSFSKILAPGTRTGWFTGPADLIERLVRASEVSAQNPSGFSMMAVYKLLEEEWGHEGFLRWLIKMRMEYSTRRNGIVEACDLHLPTNIIQWERPMAGMFQWLRVDGTKHSMWKERSQDLKTEAEKRALLIEIEEKIFTTAAGKHVLIARGSWFRAEKDNESQIQLLTNGHGNDHAHEKGTAKEVDTTIYFRMTFAAAPLDKIAEAVRRFGETLRQEFGVN